MVEIGPGPLEDANDRTIAGIKSRPLLPPLLQVRVRPLTISRQAEFGAIQQDEVALHFAHHRYLIAVVQIAPHARRMHPAVNPMPLELFFVSYARKHQELRRIKGTSAKNYLAAFLHTKLAARAGRRIVGGVRVVKLLAAQIPDANSA